MSTSDNVLARVVLPQCIELWLVNNGLICLRMVVAVVFRISHFCLDSVRVCVCVHECLK